MNECDRAGRVGRENGDDVGFETPPSSHHIGIGIKLFGRFEFSVAHSFLSNQTQVNTTNEISLLALSGT
jgi:hypothetical protein